MTSSPSSGIAPLSAADLEVAAADLVAAAAELSGSEETDLAPDPVELVRSRLQIEDDVTDVTIAASLAQIGARSEVRERWLAAFGSPLGKHLALRGGDLNAVLDVLLALVPRAQT
jgi:hypothetical protein